MSFESREHLPGHVRSVSSWIKRLTSAGTRLRRHTPSQHPLVISRVEPDAPRVATEYVSLYNYLERRYASTVVLTFEQMECLLGFSLPASACTEEDWWNGASDPAHRHSAAWRAARRSAVPNFSARTVTFERRS